MFVQNTQLEKSLQNQFQGFCGKEIIKNYFKHLIYTFNLYFIFISVQYTLLYLFIFLNILNLILVLFNSHHKMPVSYEST